MQTLPYETLPPDRLPVVVVVIGWLLIAFGILSAIGMLVALAKGRPHLDLGFLLVFVGRGLLLRRSWARTATVVVGWIMISLLAVLFLLMLAMPQNATFTLPGVRLSGSNAAIAGLPVLLLFAGGIGYVIYRLGRADVRHAFAPRSLLGRRYWPDDDLPGNG